MTSEQFSRIKFRGQMICLWNQDVIHFQIQLNIQTDWWYESTEPQERHVIHVSWFNQGQMKSRRINDFSSMEGLKISSPKPTYSAMVNRG